MDKIRSYRQPLVTSLGIFLGFILSYVSSWAGTAFSKFNLRDLIIGTSLALCIILLLIVLFRILNMKYPTATAEAYYQKTLRLFLAGISIPFIAMFFVVIRRLIDNAHSQPALDAIITGCGRLFNIGNW